MPITNNFLFIITTAVLLALQGGDGLPSSYPISANPVFNSPNVRHFNLSKRFFKTSDDGSVIQGRGLYYAEVSIGPPPQTLNLALDTAISPTLVQASNCSKCVVSTAPDFKPEDSLTFRFMPSNHSLCHGVWLEPESSKYCNYEIFQVSNGTFALDTLSTNASVSPVTFPGVAFGLGVENMFLDPAGEGENTVVGVLGLGKDHPSSLFAHQLSNVTRQRFSYCFPRSVGNKGFLAVGDEATLRGEEIQTTPIYGDHLYYLSLYGISVNGEILAIDPDVFLYQGHAGVVIDTVAPYTAIVDPAFQVLRAAVVDYFFTEFSWIPVNQSEAHQFELCYDLAVVQKRGGDAPLSSLSLTFHFEDADLEMDEEATFQEFEDLEEYCMTLVSNRDIIPSFLGVYQQASVGFLYDVGGSKLSFSAPNYCQVCSPDIDRSL